MSLFSKELVTTTEYDALTMLIDNKDSDLEKELFNKINKISSSILKKEVVKIRLTKKGILKIFWNNDIDCEARSFHLFKYELNEIVSSVDCHD